MNNPKPQEWLASDLEQGYVSDYKPFNFVDGEGGRCSLYLSGCKLLPQLEIPEKLLSAVNAILDK